MRKAILLLAVVFGASYAGAARAADGLSYATTVDGHPARVDVYLKPGVSDSAALALTLAHQALPSNLFATAGWVWPQFFGDHDGGRAAVTQYYSPALEPVPTLEIARRAQQTWNAARGSTFRFRFGGTTTRCPSSVADPLYFPGYCAPAATLDGFNDIGWGSLNPYILGVTATTFRIDTGAAIESDVALNPDFANWRTDGTGFDVETVVLHEDGHVAGLDHSPDSSSVMYPGYIGAVRALGKTDVDGMRFLYPQDERSIPRVVAELGQPAPGGGALQNDIELGGASHRGDVAFVADVPEGEGLFVGSKGQLRQVARSGSPAGGVGLGVAAYDLVGMNAGGDVAFAWGLTADVPDPFGTDGGLFLSRKGTTRTLLLPGASAPGGGVFHGFVAPVVSDRGDVAFVGVVDGPFGPAYGIFVLGRDGVVTRIARSGDTAPGGGVFTFPYAPEIAGSGDVSFHSATTAGRTASFVWRSRTGQLELVAGPGGLAPGTGTWFNATLPMVNARGDVLFGGGRVLPNGFSRGLYLAHGGVVEAVAARGDVMPDGWRFVSLLGFGRTWTLNDRGEVAFAATVEDDVGARSRAIYAGRPGSLALVVREGSVLLGIGAVTTIPTGLNGAIIGPNGDLAFEVQTRLRLLLLEVGREDD